MDLHPVGSKHMVEVEIMGIDRQDPNLPYSVKLAGVQFWVGPDTLSPVTAAPEPQESWPLDVEIPGFDHDWADRQRRYTALQLAVQFTSQQSAWTGQGTVLLAKKFEEYLKG